jgi:hypothetical protein
VRLNGAGLGGLWPNGVYNPEIFAANDSAAYIVNNGTASKDATARVADISAHNSFKSRNRTSTNAELRLRIDEKGLNKNPLRVLPD